MSDSLHGGHDFDRLLDRVFDGLHTDGDTRRLNEILRSDVDACRRYIAYVELHGRLSWGDGIKSETPLAAPPPSLSTTHYPLPTSFVGGPVFPYMVATVVLCLMLLGAWAYKITHNNAVATNSRRSTTFGSFDQPELVFVGQITGMKDCQWSDPDTQTVVGASVSLDRRYALASGLLEITYKSGAKVIIEGPCTYQVDSSAGGFLAHGKLTARIIHQGPTASAAGAIPQAVFLIKTPTAVITDLGTEFGIEVKQSGATLAYVFQGRVEFSMSGENKKGSTVQLGEGESALVEPNVDRVVPLSRGKARPEAFARNMRSRTPINIFSTGRGLTAGRHDPHWQYVNADETHQAVVVSDLPKAYSPGDPNKSQWISVDRDATSNGGTYTFRTSFDILGISPQAAVLWGRLMTDSRVTAIRLNGHPFDISGLNSTKPFASFDDFTVSNGFIAGRNTLEIDVSGGKSTGGPLLRIELEGQYEISTLSYACTELRVGRIDSKSNCINDAGLVAGYSKFGYRKYVFYYKSKAKASRVVLLPLSDNVSTAVRNCNNAGQLVGYTYSGDNENEKTAFVWSENNGLIVLENAATARISEGWAINDAGTVVGEYTAVNGSVHSFRYTSDRGMMDIGGLGGSKSCARDINDAGQIVGFSITADGPGEHAYIFEQGKMIDLGVGDGISSRAFGVNEHGLVVGYFSTTLSEDHGHAFIYDSRADRPVLNRLNALGSHSIAYDINDSGMVVGRYWDGEGALENYRAFILTHGIMYDLNDLVSLPPGCTLRIARGINNSGMIVAWGTNWGGREFACLLTPVVDTVKSDPKTISTE